MAPDAQAELVSAAGRESLSELRDRCGRTKAAADRDSEARHRRIHGGRFLRKRACSDGSAELLYRSTPDEVADIFAVAQRFADRLFRRAHRDGTVEPSEAYLADGLLVMARRAAAGEPTGSGTSPPMGDGAAAEPGGPDQVQALPLDVGLAVSDGQPVRVAGSPPMTGSRGSPDRRDPDGLGRVVPKEVVVRVDWDALVRGWPLGGEVCEIPGLGPVPASVVKAMIDSGDAVLKAADIARQRDRARGSP
jgi:hypothetical protein